MESMEKFNPSAIEDQAKNLNSTARPYDQQAFSPLDLTASWLSHLALAIYMFVVVNFDALAQASDIRIERRQVVFLCWMQDSNPRSQDTYSPADWMPADKPTELSRIKLKTWTRQPVPMISKHSAHSTSLPVGFRTWLCRYTCLLLLISMLWHRQAIFESKGDKLSSSAECRIRTQGLRHLFASRLNARWQTDWAIEDQVHVHALMNSTNTLICLKGVWFAIWCAGLGIMNNSKINPIISNYIYIYSTSQTQQTSTWHTPLADDPGQVKLLVE